MDDQQPKVYTSPDTQVRPNNQWFKSWRIIYPLLGLVLVVEIILGFKTLLNPLAKSSVQKLQPIAGARIILISAKDSYKVGETVPVTVRIATRGHSTSGTDLVLRFDPKILQGTTSSFIRGKIYNDYPQVSLDSKGGIARISGIASSAKQAFNGVGRLGTINFIAKAKGIINLTVDFKKGSTQESNIFDVNDSTDILEGVNNLKITVQ